jgi:acetolactate synthase-1/2/3 large subunit
MRQALPAIACGPQAMVQGSPMNGAESVVRTLVASGIDTCFANPGTSEMHFVAALDRVPGMRAVLGLFEGVVTGAADGYARLAGKPAATLLHCGPGLANGLANLHNARRAHVPLVNIVGDHATYHRPLDPHLNADTEGFARGVSGWVRTTTSPERVGADAAEAVLAARTPPGQVATLILPADASWGDGGIVAPPLPVPPPRKVDDATIAGIARILRTREPAMLLLADAALRVAPLTDAHRVAAATAATVSAGTFSTRIERGRGRPSIPRAPYPIDHGLAYYAGVRDLILVGARDPVAFFAYPGKPGRLAPTDARVHVLATPEEDGPDALARLADALAAPPFTVPRPSHAHAEPASGAVSAEALAATLTALLPPDAVVVDEALTFSYALYPGTAEAPPHDWLQLTGGAIGDGLPLSVGAAMGAPGRRVVNLQADGSALYTMQAMWTMAREELDVTIVIINNHRYEILFGELANVGAAPGRASDALFSLAGPTIDWVRIANGFGVEAAQAATMERFAGLFSAANRRRGPFLIELVVP